jgi:hypothetical protein
MDIEKIIEIVKARHGGLQEATAGEIMQVWNSLGLTTQETYIQHGGHDNAGRDRTGTEVQRQPDD